MPDIDAHDRTQLTTVKQWIVGKRKPNQQYTSWIAMVALGFGFVQSVTGILQVVGQHGSLIAHYRIGKLGVGCE
jgi:hypothetical protein